MIHSLFLFGSVISCNHILSHQAALAIVAATRVSAAADTVSTPVTSAPAASTLSASSSSSLSSSLPLSSVADITAADNVAEPAEPETLSDTQRRTLLAEIAGRLERAHKRQVPSIVSVPRVYL